MEDKTQERPKTSRAEIETFCMLHAIGRHGCRRDELAGRLGLPAHLAGPVGDAATTMAVEPGWLAVKEDRLSLTEVGHVGLLARLAELGVETV